MQLTSLFKKPPGYVTASILCSFGGFLFGHDTGIIGPVTVMDDFTKYVGNPSPTIHGLIVSSILIPAAVSSFFAGRLADVMGRTRAIALGSFIFALGAAIEAASVHIAMFVAGRVVEGVGEGLYLGTLVVYVVAACNSRGFEIHQMTSNAVQVHL
jgi:MFS family permease